MTTLLQVPPRLFADDGSRHRDLPDRSLHPVVPAQPGALCPQHIRTFLVSSELFCDQRCIGCLINAMLHHNLCNIIYCVEKFLEVSILVYFDRELNPIFLCLFICCYRWQQRNYLCFVTSCYPPKYLSHKTSMISGTVNFY